MISIFLLVLLSATILAACGSNNAPATFAPTLTSSTDGHALMLDHCSRCHNITRVTSAHKTAAQWKITVDRMNARGARLTPADEQTLIDYLAQTYK